MFKKSFFRELGKNTGKWASNKIFGDWSTPYRFSNSNTKLAKEALKIEQEISEQQFDNELESMKSLKIDSLLTLKESKLLYVYDYLNLNTFFIELIDAAKSVKG